MTTDQETILITELLFLVMGAERGQSIDRDQLIAELENITEDLDPQMGFMYLIWRAGQAGVEFETLSSLFERHRFVVAIMPAAFYESLHKPLFG